MSYLLEFFIKYYARDPCVRFNSVKADHEKHVVDRRLDRPDKRIDDGMPREIRITDVHLISSLDFHPPPPADRRSFGANGIIPARGLAILLARVSTRYYK